MASILESYRKIQLLTQNCVTGTGVIKVNTGHRSLQRKIHVSSSRDTIARNKVAKESGSLIKEVIILAIF